MNGLFRWLRRRTLIGLSLVGLAVAIGVATGVFTIVDSLLYRPLPFPNDDRLAVLTYRKVGRDIPPIAYDLLHSQERERLRAVIVNSGLVESLTEVTSSGFFGRPVGLDRLDAVQVDADFFEVLGLNALRGSVQPVDLRRAIDEAALPTVVIGHRLWQRLGQPEIGLGTIEGKRVSITAILPENVKFPGETHVWIVTRPLLGRPPSHVRLLPGVELSQLASRVPELEVRTLREAVRPAGTEGVVVLLLAVCLVVLLSWVQLAGLIAADMLARLRELGIRLALGATPRRMLLGGLGWHAAAAIVVGLGALLAAPWAVRFLSSVLPVELTYGQFFSLDARSMGFLATTVALGFGTLACSSHFALRLPLLILVRSRLGGIAVRVTRIRKALVVTQVTVATALLFVTSLLGHSLVNAVRYDYGFSVDDTLIFEPPMPAGDLADFDRLEQEKARLTLETIERLHRSPSVVAATGLSRVPLATPRNTSPWEELRSFSGQPMAPGTVVHRTAVGRRFVSAVGARLVQGDAFDHPDLASRRDVALVNVTFARQFGGSLEIDGTILPMNILGRRIETQWFKGTVIGVVQDLVFAKVTDRAVPQIFVLEGSSGARLVAAPPFVAIRLASGPDSVAAVKALLGQTWGPLPDARLIMLKDYWERSLAPYRGQAQLVGALALFAVPLTAIGVASFILFLVRADRRAMAIRLAVGAEPRQVRNEVLKRAVSTAAFGLIAGVAVGISLGKLMSAKLFGTTSFDAASLVLTIVVVIAMAVGAAWLPARSASRTNSSILLRSEAE